MSAPEMKASRVAPRMMITRTSGSSLSSATPWTMSCQVRKLSALRTWGRLSTSHPSGASWRTSSGSASAAVVFTCSLIVMRASFLISVFRTNCSANLPKQFSYPVVAQPARRGKPLAAICRLASGLSAACDRIKYNGHGHQQIWRMVFLRRDDRGAERGVRAHGRKARLWSAVDSRSGRARAVRACGLPGGAHGAARLRHWYRQHLRARRAHDGGGGSHKPLVASLRGHSYDKPYSYMRDYLPKMKNALYKAPEPKERVPVVLAALHPRMLALCAAEADGTHTYFVPPEHTAM